mmetsp:Transcript_50107/g.167422  ORF Transcript_50107/g.167422 Transcript_50107/m.167422 type:complete len:243 (+) Transcript_50107:448-1176(+)
MLPLRQHDAVGRRRRGLDRPAHVQGWVSLSRLPRGRGQARRGVARGRVARAVALLHGRGGRVRRRLPRAGRATRHGAAAQGLHGADSRGAAAAAAVDGGRRRRGLDIGQARRPLRRRLRTPALMRLRRPRGCWREEVALQLGLWQDPVLLRRRRQPPPRPALRRRPVGAGAVAHLLRGRRAPPQGAPLLRGARLVRRGGALAAGAHRALPAAAAPALLLRATAPRRHARRDARPGDARRRPL